MMINGRQEMLAHLARRGLVVALLAMALICATSGRAQSSVTAASAQDAKPTAAPTVPAKAGSCREASSGSCADSITRGKVSRERHSRRNHGTWPLDH